MKHRILVAMSGGVDSSVAAGLLVEAGHEVVGATMSLWENPGDPHAKTCCGTEETYGAKAVCDLLGVPHYTFDLRAAFREKVVDNFVSQYAAGLTPNPCVRCNLFLKFDLLLAKARLLGMSHVATGHYARLSSDATGFYRLGPAADDHKDQTYFLYPLPPEDLGRILFPLADMTKAEVRAWALSRNLPTAKKAESQDVCFIPGKAQDFLETQGLADAKGPILHEDGSLLGEHRGIHHFTLGQRKGLGVGYKEPLYVLGLDANTQTVKVGSEASLWGKSFTVPTPHVLAPDLWKTGGNYQIKVRYRTDAKEGRLVSLDGGALVELTEPERGITPGQSAVFYQNGVVVAGGEIGSL